MMMCYLKWEDGENETEPRIAQRKRSQRMRRVDF